MGMKGRRYPQPNPKTVKRAKEKSSYSYALWCPHDLEFSGREGAPVLFSSELEAAHLKSVHACCERVTIVRVKVLVA